MPRKSKSVGRANGRFGNASLATVADTRPADTSVIDEIRAWHRERVFAMDLRKSIDLKLGSFLRTQLGWRLDLPEDERKQIATLAAEQMESGEAGRFSELVSTTKAQRKPFAEIEKKCVSAMEQLAVTLPVWPVFGEPIRGFGPASLAAIIAEAGDLSMYANPAKLWKRMGLAVMDGVRQGGLPKSASKEDWIAHGYNRERRSRMWNIGDAIIKGNREGEYRTLYLERKEFELARNPEMKPIKAHRRAQRYMEKRLLRNLWQAWRRSDGLPEYVLPPFDPRPPTKAELRRAAGILDTTLTVPAATVSPFGPAAVLMSSNSRLPGRKRRAVLQAKSTAILPADSSSATSSSVSSKNGMSRKRRASNAVDTIFGLPAAPSPQAEKSVTPSHALPAKRSATLAVATKPRVPSALIRRTKVGKQPMTVLSGERPTPEPASSKPRMSGA